MTQQIHDALSAQLDSIVTKRIGDNRWFELGENDSLVVVDRPLGFLAQIWEALARIFTSKLARLEQKFVWIGERVEEYLSAELNDGRNEDRLGLFLAKYTEAINEIYRCASRMQQADRISQQGIENLRGRARVMRDVYMEPQRGVYPRLASVKIVNRNPNPVEFIFPDEFETADTRELQVREGLGKEFRIEPRGVPLQISTLVRQTHELPYLPGKCIVDLLANGEIETQRNENEQAPHLEMNFVNNGETDLQVGCQAGEWDIHAHGTKAGVIFTPALLENAEDRTILLTTTRHGPQATFNLGCKIAKYVFEIDAEGRASTRISPQYFLPPLPDQEVTLSKEESHHVIGPYKCDTWVQIDSPQMRDSACKFIAARQNLMLKHGDFTGPSENQREQELSFTIRAMEVAPLIALRTQET
jgi:hypothetical protein